MIPIVDMSISSGTAAAKLSRLVVPNRTGVNIITTADSKNNGTKLCRRFIFAICHICNEFCDFSEAIDFSPPFLLIYNHGDKYKN